MRISDCRRVLFRSTHIDFVSDHPGVPRMLFGELQRPGETLPKRMAQTLIRHYGERLHTLLDAGKARGELHADLDPEAAATLFKIGRAAWRERECRYV